MAITGYTFDRAKVTSENDSSLYDFLNGNISCVLPNRGNEMNVTTSSLTCEIATGQALIQGRLVEITAPEFVTIPANSNGYLCITIDLSQQNTSSGTPGQTDYTPIIAQIRTEFVTSLTTNDLLNGGMIYNFNLGNVTSSGTTVQYTKNQDAYNPPKIDIATGTNFGIVKLSDSVSSESASGAGIAATPKAVKTAYDLASSASSISNGKVSKSGDTMNGNLRVGAGSNHGDYQDGNIELFAQTPFIDFHYGNSSADFDMRIINESSGQLRITNQSNNAVLKVNSNDVLTTASYSYIIPDVGLNGLNIDTDGAAHYTVGLSEDGHGTRPQGDWMNIMNFHCGHFIAQIAIKCQNNGSAEGNQMWIRNKYIGGSWSGWSEICTKLNTLYIQSNQPSAPDNVLWAW